MSRVAVPMFVTGVALAATEASGVSVTHPLKGSNASPAGVYQVKMGEGSIPQPYNYPHTHARVQLWDATFFFASDQCASMKKAPDCYWLQDLGCNWLNGRCVGNNTCTTNTVGIQRGGSQVTPRGKVVPQPDSNIKQSQANEKQDCVNTAFNNILPAGVVTFELVGSGDDLIGTAAVDWHSRGEWQNSNDGSGWGGLQVSWHGENCHASTGGTHCPLDLQGSGGGLFHVDAEQVLYMCAIDRLNNTTGEFQISKDTCKKLSLTGQGFSNHLAPPSKDNTWPWENGVTLIDIVIVNLGDL